MCHLQLDTFHHKCCHIETTTAPSLNPSCPLTKYKISYQTSTWCRRCHWFHRYFGHDTSTEQKDGLACGNHQGRLVTWTTRLNARQFEIRLTLTERWRERYFWLERYNRHRNEARYLLFERVRAVERERKKRRERYLGGFRGGDGDDNDNDNINININVNINSSSNRTLTNTYFISTEHTDEQLFQPVPHRILPRRCLCGYCHRARLTMRQSSEGGGPCQLPCGHIFGLKCIKARLMQRGQDACPVCRRRFQLVREERVRADIFVREMLWEVLVDQKFVFRLWVARSFELLVVLWVVDVVLDVVRPWWEGQWRVFCWVVQGLMAVLWGWKIHHFARLKEIFSSELV